jgi:tetratricopeptide (TPR) repeat protein
MERLYANYLGERVELFAYHAVRAELWEPATRYLRQAGTKAADRSVHQAAAAYFEQALHALAQFPRTTTRTEQAIDIRLELRHSLLVLTEYTRLREHLGEAATLAEEIEDRRRLAWVQAYAGFLVARQLGDGVGGAETLERALAIAAQVDDFGLAVATRQFLGYVRSMLADYPRAIDLLRQNALVLNGDRVHQRFGVAGYPAEGSRSGLALALAEQGEFTESERWGEQAVRIAADSKYAFNRISAAASLGEVYACWGRLEDGIRLLTEALCMAEEQQIIVHVPRIAATLGFALALVGRPDAAPAAVQRAAQRILVTTEQGDQARRLAYLGEAHLLTSRAGEAHNLASQALDCARRQRERGNEARALRLLGEVAAHSDPPKVDQAENFYQQALALADELGMRPLVAHCHLGLGTLYRKIGRHEQGEDELATAAEMYHAMEMTFWLGRADAELGQIGSAPERM